VPKQAIIGLVIACGSGPVLAQSGAPAFPVDGTALYRSDVAGTRPHLDYDPAALKLGGFDAYPSVQVTAGGDSNVFNQREAEGDIVATIRPELKVASDWGRHAVNLDVGGKLTRFARIEGQDSDEYHAAAAARADLAEGSAVNLDVRYRRAVEPRGQSGFNPDGSGPSIYREVRAAIGVSKEFARVRASIAASYTRQHYEPIRIAASDGQGPPQTVDQSFRDVRIVSVTPRLDYDLSGVVGLFATATYADVKSTDPLSCCRRDAAGLLVLGGVHFDLNQLVVGEVAVGWRRRNFELSRYRDYAGLAVYAKIDWYPTELLSFRLSADQDIANSGLPNVAGVPTYEVGLTGYYEILRNLTANLRGTYRHESYRGIGVTARTFAIGGGAQLLLRRGLALGFDVDYRRRDSSGNQLVGSYRGVAGGVTLMASNFLSGAAGPAETDRRAAAEIKP
jgi:hypothetical protein